VDFCLRTCATEIWANNASNYPDVVFTTITKDDRLEKLACADIAIDKDSVRSVSWINPFLLGLRDRLRFGERFQAVFSYLAGLAFNRQLPGHVRALAMQVMRDVSEINMLYTKSSRPNQLSGGRCFIENRC
jgi:hypothetical protein